MVAREVETVVVGVLVPGVDKEVVMVVEVVPLDILR